MGLADELAPLIPPGPKRLDVQTPRRFGDGALKHRDAHTPKRLDVPLSQQEGVAKKTLYLREETMDAAFRKFKAAVGKRPPGKKPTESELVQLLLEKFVAGHRG